jgi:carbonic anhydrase
MTTADDIRAANQRWAEAHFAGHASRTPSRHLAVVTCMDSRIDVFAAMGLGNGEAHIIRNAGGVITDDVLRSLALSQRKLGTLDVVVVQHTDCGLKDFDDVAFRAELAEGNGVVPGWDVPGFADVDESVRAQVQTLVDSPWLVAPGSVTGLVYDVDTGRLRLVCESTDPAGESPA